MADGGVRVPPLSRKNIRSVADRVRELFGVTDPYFPIVHLLDIVLPGLDDTFVFEVRDDAEMADNHGLTYPEQNLIIVRESVYLGACQGEGRDRMTLAHELGHLVLHRDLSLARATTGKFPTYENSEWQAKAFAGELLISVKHIGDCRCSSDVIDKFGVSFDAAEYHWEILKREGLLKN